MMMSTKSIPRDKSTEVDTGTSDSEVWDDNDDYDLMSPSKATCRQEKATV